MSPVFGQVSSYSSGNSSMLNKQNDSPQETMSDNVSTELL